MSAKDLEFDGIPDDMPEITPGDLRIEDDVVIDEDGNEIVLPPTVGPQDRFPLKPEKSDA